MSVEKLSVTMNDGTSVDVVMPFDAKRMIILLWAAAHGIAFEDMTPDSQKAFAREVQVRVYRMLG